MRLLLPVAQLVSHSTFILIARFALIPSFFSAWIDDNNIFPYLDHKDQMMKLGKPKAPFQMAVNEIEAYMKDPTVVYYLLIFKNVKILMVVQFQANSVIITPARKKSITKVRASKVPEELANESNEVENNVDVDETPKKTVKVPVKRSTVRILSDSSSPSIICALCPPAKEAKTN